MSTKENLLSEILTRRRFLKGAAGAVIVAFTGVEAAKAQTPQEADSALEQQKQRDYEIYVANANREHKVGIIPDFSVTDTMPYTHLCEGIEYWGIIDGNQILVYNQKTPLFSAMSYRFGFNHPPVALMSEDETAPQLPCSFTWNDKTWWYQLDSDDDSGKRYTLTNSDQESFDKFIPHDSLQDAVESVDWSEKLTALSQVTADLFNDVRSKKLFEPDSVRFVFPDGVHPSHVIDENHEVYENPLALGVDGTKFSATAFHSYVTPSATQICLGSKEFKCLSMEHDDLIKRYIELRWQAVQEAEAKGETLPLDVVNHSFDLGGTSLLKYLEKFSATIDFQKLNTLFISSTSNDDEVIDLASPLQKYVLPVTSPASQRNAGILMPEIANGQLFEFPETLPGMEAQPIIKKVEGLPAQIAWGFAPLEIGAGGVSFGCLHLTLLAGVVASVLHSHEVPATAEKVKEVLFALCPLEDRQRKDITYQVRVFNKGLFDRFVDGETVFLPWIETGDQNVIGTP